MKSINDRLKQLRESLGLSQAAFGQKIGLERSSMSAIEHNQRKLTPRSIRDVCREYNVSGEMFREQTVCSTQGERIRFLRKSLGLTQTQFGGKVALKQAVIGQIENNQSAATPRFIRDVCREYNVSEEWLTTGSGEMFREETDVDAIAAIDRIMYGENEFAKSVFRAFASLGEEEWKVIEKLIDQIKQTPGI